MIRSWMPACVLAIATALPLAAHAQLHEGDVTITVQAGQIAVSGADHFHNVNGLPIFEGDLGDLAGGPYKTDDPGYDSPVGTFAVNAIVNYRALGSLSFWDGTSWTNAVPSGVALQLDGNGGETTQWTGSGVSGDVLGLIGQAGSDGKVHEHIDLSVTGANRTVAGAYLIQLQLVSDGLADSSPFYMAFNRGLSAPSFHQALDAITAVPEPSQAWLLAGGQAAVGGLMARRRKPVCCAAQPHRKGAAFGLAPLPVLPCAT